MVRQIMFMGGLIALLALGSLALAQDATPTLPMEGEMEGEFATEVPADVVVPEQQFPAEGEFAESATLGDVTANSPAYYGQQVTLEGVLEEYVNARTFVLSEGAVLFDSKVLVINNTPQEFDLNLVTGERVRITGIVMPSYNEGGFSQIINNFNSMIRPANPAVPAVPADPNTPAQPAQPAEPAVPAGTLDFTPLTNAIADRYPHFTILEVTSMDGVWFVPPAQ